jgi:outer membrane protein OmpA-like peptidoglycan-associated protein
VQTAEDARLVTIRKIKANDEAAARAKIEEGRRKAQEDAAAAQAQAAQAANQQAAAEAQADAAKAQADAARQQEEEARAESEKARAQQQAAEAAAAQAGQQEADMRERLKQQLNSVLQTQESARGLIVNMSDVLFDTGKFTLRPGAREKLAKVSGVLLAHPGLKIAVEGHTDIVGGDDYNQKLSEERAGAVRDYLVQQGVNNDAVTAHGFGKTRPVVSNDTAAGRQQNRRVELVVSGDVIGQEIGTGRQ